MALFEKLIIILSRISQHFVETDGFLSRSQRSTACPMPSIIEFTLHTLEVYLEQTMKAQRGEYRYCCTLSSTLVLDGVGWSTPHPGHFTPGKDPVTII